ncbi:hypothetical protein ACFE04_012385 [Oxalis oulophora]
MDITTVNNLHSGRDDWIINVRVVRLSNIYDNKNDTQQILIYLILLDEEGSPLHAIVRKNLISKLKSFLTEGEIKNPSLKIPLHYFDFASSQILSERIGDNEMLTDVIGTLDALGEIEEKCIKGKDTKILKLEILTKEKLKLYVTLWGATTKQIDTLSTFPNDHTKHLAITSTIVRKFQGEYSINSTSSTRLYVNLNISEFADLTIGLPGEHHQVRHILSTTKNELDPNTRMFMNRIFIADLKKMIWQSPDQQKLFTVRATVESIHDTKGWNYVACEICLKLLTKEGQQYTCKTCGRKNKFPSIRFKLHLQVSDITDSTSFTIFHTDVQSLVNTSVADIINSQDHFSKDIPPILQNICNCTLIFEVKLTDGNLKEG